ncbi:hypothetical protein RM574_23705 [Streptomyces sp. DSM 41982]|uniref:Uncharacterized protein n=1 Tax=Streptomyces evansiae TaxID=3075535 RepID=A0ABD5EBP0_9ACTN|nr:MULTISPECIES: hypothetical protein [unclassified Streptomyces]MDT0418493.1 hypothetical protein [Streptomyces sp. DSM 41982]SCE03159.1 hypothetical protein GA0115246_109655 [Streptomyces sp. SolWspMP-sol7th]
MKRRVEFTERVARLRDYLPPDDRRSLKRLVDRVTDDPDGPSTHLVFTNDDLTRSSWLDGAMVHFIVPTQVIYVVDADIHDAARGFNVV